MVGYYENEDATRKTLINRWLHTGDIGKLDDDGNLFLVGRSKEVIIDTSGKNVYPDEVEEAYDTSPFIRELSVVGLPDGIGEKVACMIVPDYEHDASLTREEIRKRIEEHVRDISSTLPFYKRVKVVHFWDNDLPRTATRKVKRNEVLDTMQVLEKSAKATSRVAAVKKRPAMSPGSSISFRLCRAALAARSHSTRV
jgi:long-chain acyl-CoA synthetase